jgi:hypothetical protein
MRRGVSEGEGEGEVDVKALSKGIGHGSDAVGCEDDQNEGWWA